MTSREDHHRRQELLRVVATKLPFLNPRPVFFLGSNPRSRCISLCTVSNTGFLPWGVSGLMKMKTLGCSVGMVLKSGSLSTV